MIPQYDSVHSIVSLYAVVVSSQSAEEAGRVGTFWSRAGWQCGCGSWRPGLAPWACEGESPPTPDDGHSVRMLCVGASRAVLLAFLSSSLENSCFFHSLKAIWGVCLFYPSFYTQESSGPGSLNVTHSSLQRGELWGELGSRDFTPHRLQRGELWWELRSRDFTPPLLRRLIECRAFMIQICA